MRNSHFVLFGFLFILTSSVLSIHAQEIDSSVFKGENKEKEIKELKLNVNEISVKKYYGGPDPRVVLHLPQLENNTYPKIEKITVNEFFISEKTPISLAPDQIIPKIFQDKDNNNSDKSKLIITENSANSFLGKYNGSITIHAQGFEPKTIPVEYELRWNPIVIVIITAIGLVIAWALDVKVLERGKKDKRIQEIEKTNEHIRHLNHHVNIWDHQSLTSTSFSKLKIFHELSLKAAQEKKDNKVVSKMNLALAEQLMEDYHKARDWVEVTGDSAQSNGFSEFAELEPNKKDLEGTNKNHLDSDDEKSLKRYYDIATLIITGMISIPVTLLGINYFPNLIFLDAIIAALAGFGIYSTKELGKKIRDKKIF